MIQVLQKRVLGLGAVGLDAQRAAGGGLLGHIGNAVRPHILHQLVNIVVGAAGVQAVKLLLVGQDDKLLPRAGGRHVDKLLVVFQPVVGLGAGLVGQGQREDDDILLVALKGVHRAAAGVVVVLLAQHSLDGGALAGKRRDDANLLVRVAAEIRLDAAHLLRGGVLLVGGVVGHLDVDKRLRVGLAAGDVQLVVVVFAVVELDDLGAAAVVVAQQRFVADGVAGEEALVDRVLDVVVLLRDAVAAAQGLVVGRVKYDDRRQLLRVAHEHQRAAAQDGHERHGRVALAGLVHDDHVEARLRRAKAVCRDAGRGDEREDAQQLFQVIRLGEVLIEVGDAVFFLAAALQNCHEVGVFWLVEAADAAHRREEEIAQQLVLAAIQKREGICGLHRAVGGQLALDLRQLPGLQLVLEVELAAGFQQSLDGLLALVQVENALVPFQQLGQLAGAGGALGVLFVQRALRHGNLHALVMQSQHRAQRFGGLLAVAKAQNWEGDGLPAVGQPLQLFDDAVDWVVVVAGKKHCAVVEKRSRQRVDDRIGLTGARRPLHVGQRIAHRVVDGKQLVEVDLVVQQRQRVGFAAARPGGHLAEERPQRRGHALRARCFVQVEDAAVLVLQIDGAVAVDGDEVGHVVDAVQLRVAAGDAILDVLQILRKMFKQREVVSVEELMDAELRAVDRELAADDRLRLSAQGAALDIEPQRAVGQHVQPLRRGQADEVQPQLRQAGTGGTALAVVDPALEPLDKLAELVVVEFKGALLIGGEGVAVDLVHKGKITLVGRGVQPAAGGQIVQHPQVGGVVEQRGVAAGVFADVIDERLIDSAPRAVDDLGSLDTVDADAVKLLHGQQAEVQPVDGQRAGFGVEGFDGDPVFCQLGLLVAVLDAEPLALMDGAKNAAGDGIHCFAPFHFCSV